MKIGILGAGKVARVLAEGFSKKGNQVLVGFRNPSSDKASKFSNELAGKVQTGTLSDAAKFGEVLILAINPWTEIKNVVQSIDSELFQSKPIIDVSNNIVFKGTPALAFTDISMGEYVQNLLPRSHVVKTLNALPADMMVDPAKKAIIPSIMWISGNNIDAKKQVAGLLSELGWEHIEDIGDIKKSRLQEALGLSTSIVISNLLSKG
jgi:8-hydroxy-5-deazaflavin:NADPH oxidoreductase